MRLAGRERTFYTVDRHQGTAPSVLLMHEFPGISEHLVALVETLTEHFRVVVPSIVGRERRSQRNRERRAAVHPS